MKVAISYTTKNRPELRQETLPRVVMNPAYDLHIVDGSDDVWRPASRGGLKYYTFHPNIRGGADASLAFCLSMMLNHEEKYTHVGIVEMDVLLADDWFEETMSLFDRGAGEGLAVGAVSPRSYVDRVLIQRDGYAVCHNLGAGVIIFTREAAEIVLKSFRVGWWPDNTKLFAQLSGIDLRTYAAFRGQEQFVTTDWLWDTAIAAHGLASLALTPAKCQMIGQHPSLADQGLELVSSYWPDGPTGDQHFDRYRTSLQNIRDGLARIEQPGIIHRDGGGMLFFPHQLGYLAGGPGWQGTLELKWSQGFGPFAYRAGPGGASLSLRTSGTSSFLVTGGLTGAKVALTDTRSGFNFAPDLPPENGNPLSISVPGGPVPRKVTMEMSEGAVFYGMSCNDPQMLDPTFGFDWNQLPEAK